uniref:Transposase n=1 Tax=Knipowitschia caucasica TaxID=637954 RepID=A0AAV2JXV0_KNICA
MSQRVSDLENACCALREDNSKLKAKVLDLENRSRRQNIRILGLTESTEGARPTNFFPLWLQEVFGKDILPSPPEIDRAHRTLNAKPGPGERPRPLIMIRIVEDYSAEVVSQRAQYRDVMAELYKQGMKPALLFPAQLRITLPSGNKKWMSSVEEAQQYIDDQTHRRMRQT